MNDQNPWAPLSGVPAHGSQPEPPDPARGTNAGPVPNPPVPNPGQPVAPKADGPPMSRRARLEQRMATGEFQRINDAPSTPSPFQPVSPPPPSAPPPSGPPPSAPPAAPPAQPVSSPRPAMPPITPPVQPVQNAQPYAPAGPASGPNPVFHASAPPPVSAPPPSSAHSESPLPWNNSGPIPPVDAHDKDKRAKERRRKQRRTFLAIVMSLLLVTAGGYFVIMNLSNDKTKKVEEVFDYPGPGEGSVEIVIPQGATGRQMGEILHESNVVATVSSFVQAFTANVNAASIQPGSYELQQEMRAVDAVALLIAATSRTDKAVTIQEGLTLEEIVGKLTGVLNISTEEIHTVLENPESYGLPAEAGGNPEGWLFAARYNFPPGTSPESALRQMVNQTVQVLEKRNVPRDEWLELLTKASLVEREGRNEEDRRKIAQGIENRLAVPMILQVDASLAYGLNKPGTALTTADKKADTPYNLEVNLGLPPGPIAGPSAQSIDAVLNPEPGDWLFWVTVNLESGETKFSKTYQEHQTYVAELREWQRENGLR